MKNKKGITLIALIITVIVLLILVGISITAIVGNNGVIVKAKWSEYVHEYEAVNDKKEIYAVGNDTERYLLGLKKRSQLTEEQLKNLYPIKGDRISLSDVRIVDTLKQTIEEIDGLPIEDAILYEIDFEKIDQKVKKDYIVNLKTGMLYSIQGEYYKKKMWHTPRLEIDREIEQVKNITLKYNANAGTDTVNNMPSNKTDRTTGSTTITIEVSEPKRNGYLFKGWNEQSNGSGITYTSGSTITISKDTNLYAQWDYIGSISTNKNKLLKDTTITYSIDKSKININKVEVLLGTTSIYTLTNDFKNTETLNASNYLNVIKNLTFYEDYVPTLKITTSNSELKILGNSIKNYTVGNASSLNKLAEIVNGTETVDGQTLSGERVEQISNITTTSNYIPIGYWDGVSVWDGQEFSGIYDADAGNGNRYSITLTSMISNSDYHTLGIFGLVVNGQIKNLRVTGTNSADCDWIGGIVGGIKDGIIDNCINECDITNTSKIGHGGIVSRINHSQVLNCTNKASIKGYSSVGGICGYSHNNSKIDNCKNELNSDKIIESYGYETLTWGGTNKVTYGLCGGIVGKNIDSIVSNCIGDVNSIVSSKCTNGKATVTGGIVGWCQR